MSTDGTPDSVSRETTDPNESPPGITMVEGAAKTLKTAADLATAVKVLAGVLVAAITLIVLSYRAVSNLVTKDDQAASEGRTLRVISEQNKVIESQGARLNENDVWRGAHTARHDAEYVWIKMSLERLLDDRRIPRPAEPAPATPPINLPSTIGPAR